MIQLAESILEEDTTLGIAYLLALHEVCNGLPCKAVVIQNITFQFPKGRLFLTQTADIDIDLNIDLDIDLPFWKLYQRL